MVDGSCQVEFRDHSQAALALFRLAITNFVCDQFILFNDVEFTTRFRVFFTELYKIYDKCCPIRYKTVSYKRLSKPWITNELVRMINRKHFLFRQYKRARVAFGVYNNYKLRLARLIKNSKKNHFIS